MLWQKLLLSLIKLVRQGFLVKSQPTSLSPDCEIGLFWNSLVNGKGIGSSLAAGEAGVRAGTSHMQKPFSRGLNCPKTLAIYLSLTYSLVWYSLKPPSSRNLSKTCCWTKTIGSYRKRYCYGQRVAH
jgi:hypothetical protein